MATCQRCGNVILEKRGTFDVDDVVRICDQTAEFRNMVGRAIEIEDRGRTLVLFFSPYRAYLTIDARKCERVPPWTALTPNFVG